MRRIVMTISPQKGLENLPISEIISDITEVFADWKKTNDNSWENPKGGVFQLYTNPQFVRIDCSGMKGEDMNLLIDIMLEYECPLYDPQVSKRFHELEKE